jgi:hypothetical protein
MYGSVWGKGGVGEKQARLIGALEGAAYAELHRILSRFFITPEAHGFAWGDEVLAVYRAHPAHCGLLWLDRLTGLAHAVGALPVPSPEGGVSDHYRCIAEAETGSVVAAVEKRLGTTLTFPDVCGAFGGRLAGRAFPDYAFLLLLAAFNLRQLAPVACPTVLEVGGGFGGLAYFLAQLLPCRHTIYDLPFVSAVQAYFLHRTLPGRTILLYGETAGGPADCVLLPGWELLRDPPPPPVDLAVNTDSLPEIPRKQAVSYLTAIGSCLRGPLLSINQETPAFSPDQFDRTSVFQLVEATGGLRCVQRCPFFLRPGYVQELFYPAGYFPGSTGGGSLGRLMRP